MSPNTDKTPEGTEIIHHNSVATKLGTSAYAARFQKAREETYEQLFGRALTISHELLPLVPHVDVYIFERKRGDQIVYSLVTGGMSDLEMTLPARAKGMPRRVELIFYCKQPREEYISTLRWVAHFPHDSKSWPGHGHTMPNGNPPAPFWGSTALDTLFFPPAYRSHRPDSAGTAASQRAASALPLGDPAHDERVQFQVGKRTRGNARSVPTTSTPARVRSESAELRVGMDI